MAENRLLSAAALGLGLGAGIFVGRSGAAGLAVLRAMLVGRRRPLWRHPSELGMRAVSVEFAAEDGVELKGWFIPAGAGRAPAVAVVHGWPWNRCGNEPGGLPAPDAEVDLLAPARALRDAGMHVLLFDLRNHGLSGSRPPVTFGLREARDVRAAVAYLRSRPDVDGGRVVPVGYSMGANAVLYALPELGAVRAAVAVQPVRGSTFARNFAADALGPLGPALLALAEPVYRQSGGPPLDAIDPTGAAALAGDTAVLFVQGEGDRWGSPEETRAMAEAAPRGRLLLTPSSERYGGYQLLRDHPDQVVDFIREHLA